MKHEEITHDQITGHQWNEMSPDERQKWTRSWNQKGIASFVCLTCWFPVAYGGAHCDACEVQRVQEG